MKKLRSSLTIVSASVLGAVFAFSTFTAPVWAQDSQTILFKAGAYGTYAFVGHTVTLSKTAPVSIGPGCGTPEEGVSRTKTVVSVSGPPILTTATIQDSASSGTDLDTATSDIQTVNLLDGAITANEVKAVSTTSDNGGTVSSSAAGSEFVNLVVLGVPIEGTPAPNTTITLPGFGYVVLNEQSPESKKDNVGLIVNMIHVYINTQNPLGIADNTQVIVASASSGIAEVNGPAVLDGSAYGAKLHVGHILSVSPIAPVSVPCEGDNGKVRTKSVVSLNLTGVATSGTVTDTAEGDVTESEAESQTTSTVEALNLLSSLVTAQVILASAGASTTDGSTFTFTDNSAFTNLSVAGYSGIGPNPAPNTQVDIAGLGTLWLHRVIQTKDSIEIRMVELQITQQNQYGLAIGTDLIIADAEASLHSNSKP
jgi:hypothetical protein